MKKILLYGKLNDITKDLNSYLSCFFQVQLCSENPAVAQGMIRINRPDIVIVSLVGLYQIQKAFFDDLQENFYEIPVITIGTESEKKMFEAYYKKWQFYNLIRPVNNSEIMEKICERLELDEKQLYEEYEKSKDQRKHILMVDDNIQSLRSMRKMLQKTYRVSVATSATQAMTKMGMEQPDLIILDYDMPICDGKMMLEMIRAEEKLKDIPVIFLTGISDKKHIMDVVELKPAAYFLKPPVYMPIFLEIQKLIGE